MVPKIVKLPKYDTRNHWDIFPRGHLIEVRFFLSSFGKLPTKILEHVPNMLSGFSLMDFEDKTKEMQLMVNLSAIKYYLLHKHVKQ